MMRRSLLTRPHPQRLLCPSRLAQKDPPTTLLQKRHAHGAVLANGRESDAAS